MITTNRRRQFGKIDDRPRVYHPDWYYIEFTLFSDNGVAYVSNQHSPTIKEIVSSPDGATITAVEKGFKGSKAGTYKLYFTKTVDRYRLGKYSFNVITMVRLPLSYYTDYASELSGWNGGGTVWSTIHFYFINDTPKANMITDWPATSTDKKWIHLYVPKGSLQAYANYNSTWQTVYNEGRLHEWEFKIVED